MEQKFIVLGKPASKARPRFNTKTGHAVTPTKTQNAEMRIRVAYRDQCGFGIISAISYLAVDIKAYFPVGKSDSKDVRAKKLQGLIKPDKKPDIDNIVKVYLDALNHYAWNDDKQVIEVSASKAYGEGEGRVEVTIREI